MKNDTIKTITISDEEEMDNIINKIISEKNYSGYEIGPLYTRFEDGKIIHGYDVYFYDNDGNVIDVIDFKLK